MPASPSGGRPDAGPGNLLGPEPLARVRAWFDEAARAGVPEPEAMALATASPEGMPSVRIVLLKGIDEQGIRFFTNYESRKGRELEANPRAAVTLYWQPLHRAVRLEGVVVRLGEEESDAYFSSRPRGSRLSALASRQGSVISSRESLENALARIEAEHPGEDVPRPDYWGGYRLIPEAVELWEGRPNRLHERVHYLLEPDGGWRTERLSP
jgi:pyridoxamine 5'-phosphate oxidase